MKLTVVERLDRPLAATRRPDNDNADSGIVEASGLSIVAAIYDALDGLTSGMVLVDARGRVAYANAAASAMLDDGAAIACREGRIVTADRAASAALAEVFAAAGEGAAAPGARRIAIGIEGRDGDNYVAHVLPLASGLCGSHAAVAA